MIYKNNYDEVYEVIRKIRDNNYNDLLDNFLGQYFYISLQKLRNSENITLQNIVLQLKIKLLVFNLLCA